MKKSVLIILIIIGIFLIIFSYKNFLNSTGNVISQTCIDSDENNTFVKGNVTYINFLGQKKIVFDSCFSNNATVRERRCSFSETKHFVSSLYSQSYHCEDGCVDGACVCVNSSICSDYD